jgi:flagellar basal-body rod protein FlgF
VHSGIVTAYSGLKAQMEALDVLANNLANVNTAGFKEQRSFFNTFNVALEASSSTPLESAVNSMVTTGATLNLSPGPQTQTHRDLDVALEGNGFLTVETPAGLRYTRSGNLTTNAKSVLCTEDGFPVQGETGPITLPQGKVIINEDGQISVDGTAVGKLKLAAFDGPNSLRSEGKSLFIPVKSGDAPKAATGVTVRQGYQEQSNVNPMLATVQMMEILRHFEAIQKGVGLMFNEMDAKAIEKLGR